MKSTVIAALAFALSGCGTTCNLAGGIVHPDTEPRVYGGVLRDMEIIEKVVNCPASDRQYGGKSAVFLVAGAIVLGTGDPILSFVADTLTLPITIPLQRKRDALMENVQVGDLVFPSAVSADQSAPQVEQLPSVPANSAANAASSQGAATPVTR
jgi:hypothetical protein